MKKVITKVTECFLKGFIFLFSIPVWASLPTPPESDMASGSKDWIDVGGNLINKVLSVACIAIGAAILIGVAAGILKSYHVAHEKGDLGHFFKMLVVGLLAAAIGIGLVYAGYQIVGIK
ncbi:MAG: DUF2976 domain-containing protein [Gammaproteobacteria bacterium]